MHEPRVKICGITNVEDGIFSNEHGADIIGVVRSSKSPRAGTAELINELTGIGIPVAGVYTEIGTVEEITSDENYVQLHFQHGPQEITHVKKELGRKVISVVFAYKENSPFEKALEKLSQGADLALLEYGSKGWNSGDRKIPEIKRHPVGIAGRVSIGNIGDLLRAHPYFIDVSSSLEVSPGKKDHSKISQFMEVLKNEAAAV